MRTGPNSDKRSSPTVNSSRAPYLITTDWKIYPHIGAAFWLGPTTLISLFFFISLAIERTTHLAPLVSMKPASSKTSQHD